jgi:hypothetical protein
LNLKDTVRQGTPADWAKHEKEQRLSHSCVPSRRTARIRSKRHH